MNKHLHTILASFLFLSVVSAQVTLKGTIRSASNNENLAGASVSVKSSKKNILTDASGYFTINNLPLGKTFIEVSYQGYEKKDTSIYIINTPVEINIALKEEKKDLNEVVIVSSSRTNSRIEDLPTKIEVLGTEEVGEENQIKPSNIASMLGDIAGIQIQQTNAATGSSDLRIQGLQGKYTQILRDGMPLFAGYSGSFGILQVPPLDLQQVELIKGASSTLYGGGAIAGMVNLISKKPKMHAPDRSLTLNRSTLQENNLNVFFSGRNEKAGYTLFAGGNLQNQIDVNNDGFSDVPNIKSTFVHPRFFLYPSKKSTLVLGYTLNYEERKGGDMNVLDNHSDAFHQFYIQNRSIQHTTDAVWETKFNNNGVLTAKASTGFFNRKINTNLFGMNANQTIWYSEVAYSQKYKQHNWVAGINFNGEDFKKNLPDSTLIPNQSNNTLGFFVQDDWKFAKSFTLQAGLRYDYHSIYNGFVLPRLSLMYKATKEVTMRIGGGMGYKAPTLFSAELDERDYRYLSGYSNNINAEKSYGANYDVNYKTRWAGWAFTFNQTFFYTKIDKPILLDSFSNSVSYKYFNANKPLETVGSETYIQAKKDELEIYFGYVYTNAKRKYNSINPHLPLIASNKIATVVAYEFSEHWRAGAECAYTGKQYLDKGTTTDPYLFGALMVRYGFKHCMFVLNCENLFDYRQNKDHKVVFAPYTNPTFPEIWAPLDGRVVNLSMQIKW